MSARRYSWINHPVLALLALGGIWFSAAPAEDEETIQTPQKVALQFSNGKVMRGTLVSVNDKEVRLQLPREGTAPAKFKIDTIKAIQTADGTWNYNASRKRFEKMRKPAPPATSDKPKPPPASAEESPGVIAEGVGENAKEALKDAFRSAIRKAVGTLVDSETLVKDEKVISDKVLTYSDGIISKYEKISEENDNGLVRLKIRAIVERRNLVARLRENKVTVKNVEGKDVAAEVMTRQEARANATELLQKELNELPKVLVAKARKFSARDYDEDTKSLRVDVFVEADPDKYKTFLKRLLPLLEKINLDRGFTLVECDAFEASTVRKYEGRQSFDDPILGGFKKRGIKKFANQDLPADQKGWYLWVMTSMGGGGVHTRWDVYLVDSDSRKSLAGLNGKASILVALLDKDGKAVVVDEVPLNQSTWGHHWLLSTSGAASPNVCLAPVYLTATVESLNYKPMEQYRRRIKVSVDDLSKVKDIQCSIKFGVAPPAGGRRGR